MTLRSFLFAALLGTVSIAAKAQHPVVQSIVDGVRIDSLMKWVNELSGELPVDVGNGPELIVSRHKFNEGNAKAQQYLAQKLEQFGYTPEVQTFSSTGNNLLAVKEGSVYPDQVLILCAHYDAMPAGTLAAPAADDDGSGCAALLEAARLMRNIDFAYTLVFALWDEEEQGLLGAKFYAGGMAANDRIIRGVINMDAIAYDGNADRKARIHTRSTANSREIADTVFAVRQHYNIDLDLLRTDPGATYSDHAAFWNEGYGAILVIEEFGADGNPFYHTPNDRSIHFDVPYYEKLARLSIGAFATLAEPLGAAQGVADAPTAPVPGLQVWPNPTSTTTDIWVEMPADGVVRLSLHDALGREVVRVHEGWIPQGRRAFHLDLTDLPAATYLLRTEGAGVQARSVRIVRVP